MERLVRLTDAQWARIAPLLPGAGKSGGRPPKAHRPMVEAMLWVLRTGAPWRDLPSAYGSWKSVYTRFSRWSAQGVLARLFEALARERRRRLSARCASRPAASWAPARVAAWRVNPSSDAQSGLSSASGRGLSGGRPRSHCGPAGGACPDTADAARCSSGSSSSVTLGSAPRRRRCFVIRRTARSRMSPTSRVRRCPSAAQVEASATKRGVTIALGATAGPETQQRPAPRERPGRGVANLVVELAFDDLVRAA